jgi:hypothetical protein
MRDDATPMGRTIGRHAQAGRADASTPARPFHNVLTWSVVTNPTSPFTYEGLTAASGRLTRHADDITNVARMDIADDLRLAARIADKFASLKFRIIEVAEAALIQDTAATRRDLLEAMLIAEQDTD